jgi:hypothetical protein
MVAGSVTEEIEFWTVPPHRFATTAAVEVLVTIQWAPEVTPVANDSVTVPDTKKRVAAFTDVRFSVPVAVDRFRRF